MTPAGEDMRCPRTDAVLAVHLDGALDAPGSGPGPEADDEWGFGFVQGESLQQHLRECGPCQRALGRARRLDAALASTAGRVVADHAASQGTTLAALEARLMAEAAMRALRQRPATPTQQPTPQPALEPASGRHAEQRDFEAIHAGSRATVFAGALLLAAMSLGAWVVLQSTVELPHEVVAAPLAAEAAPSAAASVDAAEPVRSQRDRAPAASASPPAVGLPLAAAGLLRDASGRTHPAQRRVPLEVLAARTAMRELPLADRLHGAGQLLHAARATSVHGSRATALALAVLVGATDRSEADRAVHAALLAEARRTPTLLSLLERQLSPDGAAAGGAAAGGAAAEGATADGATATTAAVLVAARVGDPRLDEALRRLLRRDPRACEVLAAALRCGARTTGAATLLLHAWQDQVELARQTDGADSARFWFGGQHAATFAELPERLAAARSATERVRCLLAMGQVGDDSTVELLVAHLDAARHVEAGAAALALASLPHPVLTPLVPAARRPGAWLLRAALARAGLPAADAWIESLGLSPRQTIELRLAPHERFPELAGWFRDTSGLAD